MSIHCQGCEPIPLWIKKKIHVQYMCSIAPFEGSKSKCSQRACKHLTCWIALWLHLGHILYFISMHHLYLSSG